MTSGSFFLKNLKDQLRKNIPVMILLFLAFLVALPISTVVRIENAKIYATDTSTYEMMGQNLHWAAFEFLRVAGSENAMLAVVMAGAGILLGLLQFSYLHSGEKVDFYHSLPIRREELFLTRAAGAMLLVFLPYAVNLLLTYAVGAAYGAVTGIAVKSSLLMTGFHLLYFLVIYETTVLAVLLTGNLFTALLGSAAFLVYVPALRMIQQSLNGMFFHTLSAVSDAGWEVFLSPIFAYSGALADISFLNPLIKYVVYGVILAAVLTALCLAVYRIRPSESYHRSIAFAKFQPVIKVAVVMPASLLLAVAFTSYMTRHKFLWFVLSLAFALLVFSAMVEFLYTLDIKKSLKPGISTGVMAVLLGIIAMGYHVDVFGVDAYLPEKEKIQSMSVYISSIEDKYRENADVYKSPSSLLRENKVENFDDIYKIAGMGVDYYKDKTEDDKNQYFYGYGMVQYMDSWSNNETMVSVDVGFHLKSGRTVYRSYLLPETKELTDSVEKIYDNWEYRQQVLPTSYIAFDQTEHLYTEDFFQIGGQVEAKGDAMENIYKTYKGELESMTFAQASEERIIGCLCLRQKETKEGYEAYYRLPVYESFTKTRELLEKAGSPMPAQISAADIQQIGLSGIIPDSEGLYGSYMVTDEEEMQTILDHLSFFSGKYSIDSDYNFGINTDLYWKNQEQGLTSSYLVQETPDTREIFEKLAEETTD